MLHNHPPNMATTACPTCLREGGVYTERAKRGFADEDVWSFDVYLAGVIAGGLTVLRDNLHGCPPELCENGDVDLGMKRWEAILTEIIAGFEKYHDEDDLLSPPEVQRSLELLVKWWGHFWD